VGRWNGRSLRRHNLAYTFISARLLCARGAASRLLARRWLTAAATLAARLAGASARQQARRLTVAESEAVEGTKAEV
jgi:hypothetical protein